MAGLTLLCPKCQAPLKLKDRSLLGKTGKCPKCAHRFVLQEQTEVALELVEPTGPAEGKNATWIPDSPPAQPAQPENLADLFASSPASSPGADADPLAFLSGEMPTTSSADPIAALSGITSAAASSPVASSTASPRRRKRKRRSSGGGMIAIALLLIAGGVGWYVYAQSQAPMVISTANNSTANNPPATGSGVESTAAPSSAAAPAAAVTKYNPVLAKSPTAGRPISLLHMPAGVRLVVNLHPARLWSDDRQFAEFRASLGPLGAWLETQVTELSRQPPAKIERMLIGLILGPRGTPPEVAAVIHFAEPQQRADLLQVYSGTPHHEFKTDLRLADGKAFHIVSDRIVAICPEDYVDDLESFKNTPAMTGDNIQEMLKGTDQDRLLTVVFDPSDIEQHTETMFPSSAKLVVDKTLNWLGTDVWAAAWSLHYDKDFYSELAVRGTNEVGTLSLSQRYQQRLDVLPELLLTAVQKMNPQRSGYRQLIGRFPAMMKVVALAASVAVDGRFVRMGTLLPPKAAPNLALGTLLTWDESTRTDFTRAVAVARVPSTQIDKSKLPLAERLKLKFDVDFRRTPLQEAFAYIAEESKIAIDIDGDALKLAGFTKNMPQTFALEQATTLQAIYGIIKTYENEPIPMAIHIDEANNQIVVLTSKVAEDRQLKTYDFKANGF